ncbi:DUF1854 domain-containing protein [Propionivibrio sp.]|uniref:cyanophycin metabolism-associated DUF1854 family protein n=1 Tax=Propionivibrio sp. TaxID=2212460 RepID=UPI003BF08A61
MNSTPDYQLGRDTFGRLLFTGKDGELHEGVVPVRAFPISSPDHGIALVDAHGSELAWIDQLSDLPDELRTLVEAELASREFMPVISRIINVSSFATPSTWQVITNHGDTNLVLKGEEDIRRLASPGLLITDSHGIHYLIHDRYALDQHSRKILDRFL